MADDSEGPSGSSVKVVTRRFLYNIMKRCPQNDINKRLEFLETEVFKFMNYSEVDKTQFKHKMSQVKSQFKTKWMSVHKKEESFLKNYDEWLNGTVSFSMVSSGPSQLSSFGRPPKSFERSSLRTIRRKTEELRRETPQKLMFAAQMTHKADVSKVLQDLTTSPKRASKYRKAFIAAQNKSKEHLTPEKALQILVDAGLTKAQYEIVRSGAKSIYPCYSLVKEAKKKCYPNSEAYRITQTCAEVRLQDLLDHTSIRLALYLSDVLQTLNQEEKNNIQLITKWGCDGSQQAQYKQKFDNSIHSDANIFQSSLVPLRLIVKGDTDKLLWQNPTPSSPRFCRPIRIRFVHETVNITNEEINYIRSQEKNLQKSILPDNMAIQHILLFTMVDAKVCNAATDTKSTMRCYICGKTSKDFNKLEETEKVINPETLKFGLSILHARIRFFESLLHLAYKLPIKKWQMKLTQQEKDMIALTKKSIQDKFKDELGLLVDIPKPGFGNTNDGNTSRRFFQDPALASRITGIDEDLIFRFKIILETLSSGFEIDIIKFKNYTTETAKLYVQLYSWHPMTPTLHKVLIHGATVISAALLPIGQLSEEAAEARNKHFRLYRSNYARKFSREGCNRDVIDRLLLTSDPFLSCSRSVSKKITKAFSKETLDMLICSAQLSVHEEEEIGSSDDDDVDE